jgi:hypothetical protein
MSSPIYQKVIDLVVCLSIRRGPGVFMDVAMGEHGASDNLVFSCGKVYYSNSIIHGSLKSVTIRTFDYIRENRARKESNGFRVLYTT